MIQCITLGTTGITTPQNAFGALPIQRVSTEAAVRLLHAAHDGGMTFFDTARAYSDSEEKLGRAFHTIRNSVVIATKTTAKTPQDFWRDLNTSLDNLKTNVIDLYQFHWPSLCYRPDDGTGMYECMLEAKRLGKIRHIGFTNHSLPLANECVDSGLYATLQYPFSYLSSPAEIALAERCQHAAMGFIAMKALAGGLIRNTTAAMAFVAQFENVVPIWGIQRASELDEFLRLMTEPTVFTSEIQVFIERERRELAGDFCRGCGYCMPCPVGITINLCARMSLFIRRFPADSQLTEKSQAMMRQIEDCTKCGQCRKKCPYGLDTPELLARNYADYKKIVGGEIDVR